MATVHPVKPADVDPLAAEILSGLEKFPCARHVVLGGHFALKHYCDFRSTHDMDAWWSGESTESDRAEEQADYVHRVSAQWDYGIVPEPETFQLFRQWKEVFDRFPMRHSAAFHSFRSLFGWEAVGGRALRAGYEIDDLKEGRTDPCALWT
jgi:hypothetical protein